MNLPPFVKPSGHIDGELSSIYDYLTSLDFTLRQGKRFGWPLDCPLLLANSTSSPGTPSVPAFVQATGLYQEVALSWDLDTNPSILDFEIARATSSGGALTIIGHTQGNCFLDSELADSTAYFYKIQARQRDGTTYSGLSAEATATTLANDSTTDAQLALALRLLYCNTDPRYITMQFHSGAATVAAGATVFLGRDQAAVVGATRFLIPLGGVVVRMSSQSAAGAGVGQTFTYTFRFEATNSTLTHQTTGAVTQASSVDAITVARNNAIAIKLDTSAGAALTNHMVTIAMRVFE